MLDAHQPFRDFVYSTKSANGTPVYVRTSGKPLFDARGNFLGYRGTATDITATIRADHAERALREAQAALAHVTRVTTLGELKPVCAGSTAKFLTWPARAARQNGSSTTAIGRAT